MAAIAYSLEADQRRKALTIIILITLVASVSLAVFDIQFMTPLSVLTLAGLSLACIPMLLLNWRGRSQLSAALWCLVILVAITLNVYDGDGVHDPGLLTYPILVLAGTLLFGKRAAPYFALVTFLAVVAIVYLEVSKQIHPRIGPTTFGILIPVGILFLASAIIAWVILNNLERNLQRARDSEAELARSYDLTLEAWATILEHRDRDTQGHTRRVASLTEQLARALGLTGQSLVDLHRGALLHDIGKMGMPDSVLLKRGTLTDTEWAVVREHPTFAHDLLAPIHYLTAAADIPWCHHEKWDGSGYPRGLAGEQIPLAARIFSVVDVWDALTTDRPYRAAWSGQQARDHIRSLSGQQFDPKVVDAFLALDLDAASTKA